MSLAGLMPPVGIHPSGSGIGGDGASRRSLQPLRLQGREKGWGCQAGAVPPPSACAALQHLVPGTPNAPF